MADGFTLLESGTSRLHFQLVKALEEAPTEESRNRVVHDTLEDARRRIASAASSSDPAKLASVLLTVLHCTEHYPYKAAFRPKLDLTFALMPTLQLLSMATKWKQVIIAHQLLRILVPPPHKNSDDDGFAAESENEASTSSLLLINTFRKHLIETSPRSALRASQSLLSLAQGVPSGLAVLSSLAAPLLDLTRHKSPFIRKQAIDAMLRCSSYEVDSTEMLDAALTVVRLMLASTYSFAQKSTLGEQSDLILAELERRTESDPSVLKACLRVVDECRDKEFITDREAACHAMEILQAVHYIDSDKTIPALQHAEPTNANLAGIRFRVGARDDTALQREYDYHGLYCPWLVNACLASLRSSAVRLKGGNRTDFGQQDLLTAVLSIYSKACVGKAASLAVCVSAARCIGILSSSSAIDDATLWTTLSVHVKAQLSSANANRNIAALELLDALLPTRWHEPSPSNEVSPPFSLNEAEMGKLMGLVSHTDDTVRKRALRLLHRIDDNLVKLHQSQIFEPIYNHVGHTNSLPPETKKLDAAQQLHLGERIVEATMMLLLVKKEKDRMTPEVGEEVYTLVQALFVSFRLGLFSPTDAKQVAAAEHFAVTTRTLGSECRAGLCTELSGCVAAYDGAQSMAGLHLIALLLCDVDEADIAADKIWLRGLDCLSYPLIGNSSSAMGVKLLAVAARFLAVAHNARPGQLELKEFLSHWPSEKSAATVLSSDLELARRNLLLVHDNVMHRPHQDDTTLQLERLAMPYMSLQEAVDVLLTLDKSAALDADGGDSTTSFDRGRNDPLTKSSETLRSPSKRSEARPSPAERPVSAIPSEAKRNRDRQIATAFSRSAAQLVLGTEAQPAVDPSYYTDTPSQSTNDTQLIFSASSSDFGSLPADNMGEETPLVIEVVDPDRSLESRPDVQNGSREPSLMDLVHQCHNFDPWSDPNLHPFVIDGTQIGFMPPVVYQACLRDEEQQRAQGLPVVFAPIRFQRRDVAQPTLGLSFSSQVGQTADTRSKAINGLAQRWRAQHLFPDPLDGWRDELYAVYGPRRANSTGPHELAFKLERSACALFGFATFGVHLTAYTHSPAGDIMVWVPTRSATKSTWPGYLDNSVAGGIVAGDAPMASIIRECQEEAALTPSTTEKYIRQTGVLSYCYRTAPNPQERWIQPEVEYVYDLPLPADITLAPKDGEVESFALLSLPEVNAEMRKGRFKPNCVLVLLDFLIRHGHITADDEPEYRHILAQIHTDLRLPGP